MPHVGYILQYSNFASERSHVRTWERQTCFLPLAPFNLVTPCLACEDSCNVTIPQFCHAWWCWRNTPDLLHISQLGKRLCWCSFAVCECMERKWSFKKLSMKLNFSKQFLRPRQSGAHDTCHACHTLDTPLIIWCTTTDMMFRKLFDLWWFDKLHVEMDLMWFWS